MKASHSIQTSVRAEEHSWVCRGPHLVGLLTTNLGQRFLFLTLTILEYFSNNIRNFLSTGVSRTTLSLLLAPNHSVG